MQRRRLLRNGALLGSVLAAGCSAGYGIDDAFDLGETLHEGEQRLELQPGTYEAFDFELDRNARLEYTVTVTEGPDVDVLLMDEENYSNFEELGDWEYFPAGTTFSASDGRDSAQLAPDHYYLVVDNTGQGGAAPSTPEPRTAVTATFDEEAYQLTAVVDFSYEVTA